MNSDFSDVEVKTLIHQDEANSDSHLPSQNEESGDELTDDQQSFNDDDIPTLEMDIDLGYSEEEYEDEEEASAELSPEAVELAPELPAEQDQKIATLEAIVFGGEGLESIEGDSLEDSSVEHSALATAEKPSESGTEPQGRGSLNVLTTAQIAGLEPNLPLERASFHSDPIPTESPASLLDAGAITQTALEAESQEQVPSIASLLHASPSLPNEASSQSKTEALLNSSEQLSQSASATLALTESALIESALSGGKVGSNSSSDKSPERTPEAQATTTNPNLQQDVKQDSAKLNRGENPFLPKHILDRLNQGRNLVEEIAQSGAALDASTAILRTHARAERLSRPSHASDTEEHRSHQSFSKDKSELKKQKLIDDLVEDYLPLLAAELRRRLRKMLDE